MCTTGLLGYAETNSTLTQNLKFTENKKQWAPHILFQTDFNGGRLFLEQNTFTYVFYENGIFEKIHPHDKKNNESIKKEIKLHSLKIHLLNSNTNTVIAGKNETPDYRNYFIGNDESKWASNVKSYKEVVYSNVYDNIDLKIYSSASNTKTDYIVKQNGDVNSIQLSYKGQYKLSLKNNHLYIKTSVGNIIEQKPYAYQIINGIETEVPCYFSLNNNVLSFKLPNGYNKNLPLIIDPTLIFSTFSGSTDDNWGMTATYDAAGNAYAGGIAWGIGYPTTVGAYQTFFAGGGAGGSFLDSTKFSKIDYLTDINGVPSIIFVYYIMSATTLAQRQYYRKRVKGSMCTKKSAKQCRRIKSCKNTRRSAKRINFCRKKTNTKRRKSE